tara:strand:+ start:1059 stop:1502 length:444 start_codon:yes stop_codon:yes gene_type:complete
MDEAYYVEETTVEDVVSYVTGVIEEKSNVRSANFYWDLTWLSYDEQINHPMFGVFKDHCSLVQQIQSSHPDKVSKELATLYQGILDITMSMKETVDKERARYELKGDLADDSDKLELYMLVCTFLAYYAHLYSYYDAASSSMKLAVN